MQARFSRLPRWWRIAAILLLELAALLLTARVPLFEKTPWLLSLLAIGVACGLGEIGAALVMLAVAAVSVNLFILSKTVLIARPSRTGQTAAFVVVASVLIYLVRQRNSALSNAEANESHYRSLTETAPDVVVSIDRNSVVLSVNPAVEAVFGYTPEELVGTQITQLMPERYRDVHKQGLARYLTTGQRAMPWTGIMLTGLHKDGREIPLEVSFGSYQQEGATFFTGFIRDISERRKVQAALMESEKLAAVGRLASSIAHEINNPLEAVTNLLYLAQRADDLPAAKDYLRVADAQLARVSVIANQTLRFHKRMSTPQAVAPAQLIQESLALFQGRLVNLKVEIETRNRACRQALCVEGEVCQVLHNLIGNALDALGSQGGKLLVRTRDATHWSSGCSGVVVTVADNGPGMSREVSAKIFDAFFSTKGNAGVGLGLWITSQLVTNNSGRLRVRSSQSEKCHGTVFSLFLPAPKVPSTPPA